MRVPELLLLGLLAAALWGALAAGSLASVLIARALGEGHAAMTSVLQGGIRFNNLMGFAVAGAIGMTCATTGAWVARLLTRHVWCEARDVASRAGAHIGEVASTQGGERGTQCE